MNKDLIITLTKSILNLRKKGEEGCDLNNFNQPISKIKTDDI